MVPGPGRPRVARTDRKGEHRHEWKHSNESHVAAAYPRAHRGYAEAPSGRVFDARECDVHGGDARPGHQEPGRCARRRGRGEGKLEDALKNANDIKAKVEPVVRNYQTWVATTYKGTPSTLADFGVTPRKVRTPLTAEQKVTAAKKAAATRAARHTMSKKQKKNVKGTVPAPGARHVDDRFDARRTEPRRKCPPRARAPWLHPTAPDGLR